MEKNPFEEIINEHTNKYTNEEIQLCLNHIDWYMDNVDNLIEEGKFEMAAQSLGEVLDVLPEDIKVLCLDYETKDVYASRIKTGDEIIQVWWRHDLDAYIAELNYLLEIQNNKVKNFPLKWE